MTNASPPMSEPRPHNQIHSTSLPPAQPVFVLRGHASAVHSLHFLRCNTRLLSGDADGFVVYWDLTIKRPIACWQPHDGSILGLGTWGADAIITHGRDSRLRIWRLSNEDERESDFSTLLPVDGASHERKQPWLLHSVPVSTLNFCGFASCYARKPGDAEDTFLFAVPSAEDTEVALYSLASEVPIALIPAPNQSQGKTGMVMALHVFQEAATHKLHVAVGYESGRAVVFRQQPDGSSWQEIYASSAHKQPILSLDASSDNAAFFTSGADAALVKHPLLLDPTDGKVRQANGCLKEVQTGHAGQQSLHVRSDGRILATAGWDGRVRVYSSKTLKEVAVLKWHKDGVYAAAFAPILHEDQDSEAGNAVTQTQGRVAAAREQKTRSTHWLAAGAKDGKVSLWDMF